LGLNRLWGFGGGGALPDPVNTVLHLQFQNETS